MIMTATLSPVAAIDNLMIKEENVPFCFTRYRRAMKNERFKMYSKVIHFSGLVSNRGCQWYVTKISSTKIQFLQSEAGTNSDVEKVKKIYV